MMAPEVNNTILTAREAFSNAAVNTQQSAKRATRKRPAPFSLRLTESERSFIKRKAGKRPMAAYIRSAILDGHEKPRRGQNYDQQKLALVLSALGQSRLSQNINQLAKAANMGTLDFSPETERSLQNACAEIIALRQILIEALGLKARD